MASAISDHSAAQAAPLASVLARAPPNPLLEDVDHFRRYRAVAQTSLTPFSGVNSDVDLKTILYEVGVRNVEDVIGNYRRDVLTMSTAAACAPFNASEFATAAAKYSNFSGSFVNFDLAALTEQLAAGMAQYSINGFLTCNQLASGVAPTVVALDVAALPVAATTHSVFLPRCADTIMHPNVFTAIVHACAAVGSRVVTDVVHVNNLQQPIIPVAADGELAMGCYQALVILGANYVVCGQGQVFSLAVTRGIHRMLSVVGHSDEGGALRRVLRSARFQRSYGGIKINAGAYIGLPRPVDCSAHSFALLVDSIAISTAAAVAACDPLIEKGGRLYPTVSTADGLPGDGLVPDNATPAALTGYALSHARQLANTCGDFCRLYTRALSEIFLAHGSSEGAANAEITLATMFSVSASAPDRHLQYAVVAPFYWIEPTSVCKLSRTDYPAVGAGFAQLCETDAPREFPMFDRVHKVEQQSEVSHLTVEWRSARTCGLAAHLMGHPADGLANVRITGGNPDDFGLCRQEGGLAVRANMLGGGDLASYMWGRGQSPFPHPAEVLYTGAGVKLSVRHAVVDPNTWQAVQTHVPSPSNIVLARWRVAVTVPEPMGEGAQQGLRWNRTLTRQRNRSLAALSLARRAAALTASIAMTEVTLEDCGPGTVEALHVPGQPSLNAAQPQTTDRQLVYEARQVRAPQTVLSDVQPQAAQAPTVAPLANAVARVTVMAPHSGSGAPAGARQQDVAQGNDARAGAVAEAQ